MSNVLTVPADKLAELQRDAARYRFLAGADVPPHSLRWPRWRLERWAGFHGQWEAPTGTDLDAAVDSDMKADATSTAGVATDGGKHD